MFKIKLIVDENERWLNKLHYEYFCPIMDNPEYYKKFLQFNFPYQIGDDNDMFLSNNNIPIIKLTNKDKELQSKALENSKRNISSFSVFDNTPKTPKEVYYKELSRLRYNERLDHGIIPNLDCNYDRYLRPQQAICKHIVYNKFGGIFNLELESSSNDDFWYEWMLSMQLKNGKLEFYDGDGDLAFKIQFWDCFCVRIGEKMSSVGSSPMTMQMRLSPAITRNRGVEHQKVWKLTDLSSNNKKEVQEEVAYDDLYMVDEKNNKINQVAPGMHVELVIKTSGCTGKSITIDLSNEECDYKYNGDVLEGDILSNYTINQNIERVPLDVIEQQ